MISNLTIRDSRGGDPTQGAGALTVHSSAGQTSGLNVTIQDSVFASNQALTDRQEKTPATGVAGAVRIYANSLDTSNRAQFTNTIFSSNSLDATCTGLTCMAGALAVSVQASIDRCTFDNNSCPRCSGALYAERVLNLSNSIFTSNTAQQVIFGTANVGTLRATNTTMQLDLSIDWLPGSNYTRVSSFNQGGFVFSELLSGYNKFRLTCPPGQEINSNNEQGKYFTCAPCDSGQFSFVSGEWHDGDRTHCDTCPILPSETKTNLAVVVCENNTVKSQPGYYAYFKEQSSRVHAILGNHAYAAVAVSQCPNQEACTKPGKTDSTWLNTRLVVGNSTCDKLFVNLLRYNNSCDKLLEEENVNSTCANLLSACNTNTGGKCAEGYTGTNTHTHRACYFNSCLCRDALCTMRK